ncbi:transposase [Streptomyces rubiginosohelvolus]|uniref:transposase n=1 Tax=Streptomyces rubiginosohelvolus TaxID=67362 RepID=UPI0037877732
MRSGRWGWIVPDGLWEIARPLLPPDRVRTQGGGVANIDDEAVFAAIIYVLVSGCAARMRRIRLMPGQTIIARARHAVRTGTQIRTRVLMSGWTASASPTT